VLKFIGSRVGKSKPLGNMSHSLINHVMSYNLKPTEVEGGNHAGFRGAVWVNTGDARGYGKG
jgi:hypothetical protein